MPRNARENREPRSRTARQAAPSVTAAAASLTWKLAVLLTIAVTTASWLQGASLTVALLRGGAACLALGILGWGVTAILLSGEQRLQEDARKERISQTETPGAQPVDDDAADDVRRQAADATTA